MILKRSPSLFNPDLLGDLSERDPPVPIPNTEVKLLSPDGTAQATVWESRKSPGFIPKPSNHTGGLFLLFFRLPFPPALVFPPLTARDIVESRLIASANLAELTVATAVRRSP